MWIDPTNPKYILSGSDGGWQVSYDGGKNFEVVNTFPFTQFYHINYDMQRPYMVCGGLQDNGNWCGAEPGAVGAGQSEERLVHRVGRRRLLHRAGDGQAVARLLRRAGRDAQHHRHAHRHAEDDLSVSEPRRLGRRRDDQPQVSLQLELADRAVAASIRRSCTSAATCCSSRPTTACRGRSISPDLTTNDPKKQESSGGPIVVDNTAAEFHCTIITIAPSPLDSNVIWVGTDDGNVQVTRDGGKTWSNVFTNVPGLKPNAWIPTVDASHSDAGTAYVAADHHQDDDYAPYAYMTTDYGKTWKSDHRRPAGVGGVGARRARGSAQPQPAVHRHRDGRVGVVGRGRALDVASRRPARRRRCATSRCIRATTISCSRRTAAVSTSWTTSPRCRTWAPPRRPMRRCSTSAPRPVGSQWNRDGNLGQKKWTGENPPAGALITYFLKTQPPGEVNITIYRQGRPHRASHAPRGRRRGTESRRVGSSHRCAGRSRAAADAADVVAAGRRRPARRMPTRRSPRSARVEPRRRADAESRRGRRRWRRWRARRRWWPRRAARVRTPSRCR